ncbi:MAG: hypothetical protein ACOYOP_11255 [Microthrixaceae bacterium]
MSTTQVMRALRILALGLAAIAAVVVFVVGGRDGGQDWQVPALVLIGVLALIVALITSPYTRAAVAVPVAATGTVPSPAVPGGVAGVAAIHGVGPHHLADPSAAESGPVAGLPADAHGLPGVVVPASSFPDAGHSHGPVIAVHDGSPPPPLHAVLAPVPAASAAPAPADFTASSPDSVMVDLRPETEEPMVTRLLDRPPPAPGDRADVAAPPVADGPVPPAPPPWSPPTT